MKTQAVSRLLPLLVLSLSIGIAPAAAEEFEVPLTLEADHLVLVDLIGEVVIEGHDGSDFEIEIRVRGEDADPDLVQVTVDEGDRAEVRVEFPIERESRFVYPRLDRGSDTTFRLPTSWRRNESVLDRMIGALGGHRVKVSGSGRGLEVWADVTIRVPSGRELRVELGVGEMEAVDVEAALDLDTRRGAVSLSRIEGDTRVNTGSGAVTGEDLTGDLLIDTGSGQVELRRCDGGSISVDTGSGEVRLAEIECDDLLVDTGSGSVQARAVRAEDVSVDTGSGGIVMELERMGDGRFVFDTGSGSIDLRLPDDASAQVVAETGSGRIRIDLAGELRLRRHGHGEAAFRIGDGDAAIHLDTGSGSITVSQ